MNAKTSLKGKLQNTSNIISLIIVLIIICIAFTCLSPYFLSIKNFLNIGTAASITGIMAAGSMVVMLLGHIDMSQYAILSLSSIVAALMLQNNCSLPLTILVTLLTGLACGAVNGLIVSCLKISGIICTMGTMNIFRGIAYLVTSGSSVMVKNTAFSYIGRGYIFDTIPFAVLLMAVVFLMEAYMLKYTSFGRKVYAVGGNEKASFLAGINSNAVKFSSMLISGFTAAVAGLVCCSQVGSAVPSVGQGSEMSVLSAVILGGVSLSGGKGKVSGTVLGIFILAVIQNGMTLLSIPSFYQYIINGTVLILAVLMDIIKSGALKRK